MRFLNAIGLITIIALTFTGAADKAKAGSASEINASVHSTLDRFYRDVRSSRELASKAYGILVFPTVVKAGFGFGGEYGEGSLLVHGRPTQFYNSVSGSFGFQIGAQARSVIIMFMTPEALDGFCRKDGWKIGVDGSVTVIAVGVGGDPQPDCRLYIRPEREVRANSMKYEREPAPPRRRRKLLSLVAVRSGALSK